MSEKKQIVEEMARHIPARIFAYDVSENSANLDELHREIVALHLYRAGYRKQSEPISCGHEKGGEWTKHLDEWDCEYAKCSCCGEEFYDSSGEDVIDMFYKFCPNCGAKMKGGAE